MAKAAANVKLQKIESAAITPKEFDAADMAEFMDLAADFGLSGMENCMLEYGKSYLIRTATYFWLARFNFAWQDFLFLDKASWIPDTGRFSEMFIQGIDKLDNSEVEPIPHRAIVNCNTIIDIQPYSHPLPTAAK